MAFNGYVSPFETSGRLSEALQEWSIARTKFATENNPEKRAEYLETMLSFVTADNPPARHQHRASPVVKALRWVLLLTVATGLALIPVGSVCVVFFGLAIPL